jgi:hypothetical protein
MPDLIDSYPNLLLIIRISLESALKATISHAQFDLLFDWKLKNLNSNREGFFEPIKLIKLTHRQF